MDEVRRVVIIGGAAGSKLAQEIFLDNGYDILGFMNNYVPEEKIWQLKGNIFPGYYDPLSQQVLRQPDVGWFVGTGDNRIRKQITEELISLVGKEPLNCIHKYAIISPTASIGYGNLIMTGAVINCYSDIGNGNIINSNSVVEHDNKIGNYVQISPGAILGGYVTIEDLAYVNIGANIGPHVTIGTGSVVRMGSVVLKDVEPYVEVQGIPAVKVKDVLR